MFGGVSFPLVGPCQFTAGSAPPIYGETAMAVSPLPEQPQEAWESTRGLRLNLLPRHYLFFLLCQQDNGIPAGRCTELCTFRARE
jgi:hypothetical protein